MIRFHLSSSLRHQALTCTPESWRPNWCSLRKWSIFFVALFIVVAMDSDIISVLMKAVFPVLANRLTWGLLLWPWWLKTPSSLHSPCRFTPIVHRPSDAVHTRLKPTLFPESTRWCKPNLVVRSKASQPWSTPVTLGVWWSSPSMWVTSFIQTTLDH